MEQAEEGGRGRGCGRGRGRGLGRGRGHGRGIVGRQSGQVRQRHAAVSNEIRAAVIDHVINRGLTMKAAGLIVQPNLGHSTVLSIIHTFCTENRKSNSGSRGRLLTELQESTIVEMVPPSNDIHLREIQSRIDDDVDVFHGVNNVSLSTIDCVLKRHQIQMKQIYAVPFERNSEGITVPICTRMMEFDASMSPCEYIFFDEAGFNLAKRRRRGRNIIGQRATVDVPG
ncbi:hypothetical protein AOXY_G672 [Acipenser oxyrinchus oxyrinchus]|uniref:Uncharacterized protein n=1 Tax=Acipenser oxyrinchus oxyrinchus TaxID=40147 RepID=A0AAD8LTN7_ACIOX|nr:hypothetical protein AOXY_G672 [Acipenser oxyrinchus oxyrinchus]